jgi:allophanate hydrolase subunit 1
VLFDATRARPSLLWPGDRVRFRAVSREEFLELEKNP